MLSHKLFLLILLLNTMPFASYCQSPAIDCSQDSTAYLALSKMLDTTEVSNIYYLDLLNYSILSPSKKRDYFCDLLIYARIFDFMLEEGLDLNYQVKHPPMRNSTNFPTELAQVNSNNKYYLFRHFLKIKEKYEKSVLKCYKSDKSRMLAQDIENILKYHTYAYPGTLKGILLGNYSHLTQKKFQAQLEKAFNELEGKH